MKEMVEKAAETFNQGHNCSQSVLMTCAGFLGLDQEVAKGIASGFGAGMGRLQQTCGAVTGAHMVIGLHYSRSIRDNEELKEEAYFQVKEFERRFTERHGSTNCKELLGVDFATEEGRQKFKDDDLIHSVCERCVRSAIELLCTSLEGPA